MFGRSGRGQAQQLTIPGLDVPDSPRKAGDFNLLESLVGFSRKPLGIGLAGIPIAMGAFSELNKDPNDPMGNAAAATASGLGGAAMLALGASRFVPGPIGLGAMLAAPLVAGALGSGARGTTNAIGGMLNDPTKKAISDAERMARSARNQGFLDLPLARAQQQAQLDAMREAQQIADASMMRQQYGNAVLGVINSPRGVYRDPNFSAALGGIAQQALV